MTKRSRRGSEPSSIAVTSEGHVVADVDYAFINHFREGTDTNVSQVSMVPMVRGIGGEAIEGQEFTETTRVSHVTIIFGPISREAMTGQEATQTTSTEAKTSGRRVKVFFWYLRRTDLQIDTTGIMRGGTRGAKTIVCVSVVRSVLIVNAETN